MLSNLCSDNNIQKYIFFHFYKFCKSYNHYHINYGKTIHSESSEVFTDTKTYIKLNPFKTTIILSFNEGNLHHFHSWNKLFVAIA